MRIAFLKAVTLSAVALVAITEGLGAVGALARWPVALAWLSAAALAACFLRFRSRWSWPQPLWIACAAILAITGLTALLSPPNSADALSYHVPRIVYWTEMGSVRVFPTSYLNQVMLQPLAEYAMLHLYLLTGGDRWLNLVQWSASAVSLVAVSLAAGLVGAGNRGQAFAALFCATLPSGVLASSGAKNDYVLAMWMTIAACFAILYARQDAWKNAALLGCAAGLALLTKGTAYLFLPFLILFIAARQWRRLWIVALCALAVNAPFYVRNYRLSGSPLGFDSAQADGFFRWRNESFGWKQTVSNLLRHTSEQLGARSQRWNRGVYDAVLETHRRLGIDPNDPDTTWRWSEYAPPRNSNHEADAPNRWHLALLVVSAVLLAWRRDRRRLLFAASLVCGFVAYCFYLKWQPFMARLVLPLFVTAAPLAAVLGDLRSRILVGLLCVFLLDTARLPLLQNWTRPLTGPASVFRLPRDQRYFADMSQWNNRESYVGAARFLAGSGCGVIGIDIRRLHVEYPLIALIRESRPGALFVHTGVENPSRAWPQPVPQPPCAVACLDCLGDGAILSAYPAFRRQTVFGRFVVLTAPEQPARAIPPSIPQHGAPVDALALPPVGSEVHLGDAPEERSPRHDRVQLERRLLLQKTEEFVNRRNLQIVERQPAAHRDARAQAGVLELRHGIRVRSVEEHEVEPSLPAPAR